MKVISKTLELGGEEYFLLHYSVINNFIPNKMTDTEMKMLASFKSLDKPIIEEDMFNTLARKMVKKKLGGMTSSALSNHLSSLINKSILNKNETTGKITLAKFLEVGETVQAYQFKIVKKY